LNFSDWAAGSGRNANFSGLPKTALLRIAD
jgi:hypothetical protein